ncbi:hypothetical protein FDP22_20330 (plasmid) [Paroceanicella profunda]|uniref:Uncharacterized protein n=1 Tax=Paroceanicella profunda TaxID=2579971 RepID=A0A5B8G5F6_9RHOB|nr:DUF6165 family protein [Paroceanicella profunda]QDL94203.1 hypothetical protein FDP22_20330 [Paroceanicella profunda]
MKTILTPVAPGELIDKITILRLKASRIGAGEARANVCRELALLEDTCAAHVPPGDALARLTEALAGVNAELWDIEDAIRDCERRADFGPDFIALARAVYRTNDRRAALKREINLALGSDIVEEKSYTAY